MNPLLQIGDALTLLKISRSTLLRWEKRGMVRPFKNHARWRFYSQKQIGELQERMRPKQAAASKRRAHRGGGR
ncbi:MAG: MerR family transcriptional regulator [Elusimicrobia bacterium]|nr:MerR family transcriptional regulator [Elusimicrobiota bacterium]